MSGRVVRVLHLSDIHCGRTFVPQHIAAAEQLAAAMSFNAIVISGDLSQRARAQEFREARVVLDRFARLAPIITVPGNHDTAWWRAPFGMGDASRLHEDWRALIQPDTEPTLRVPGVSVVGLNSAAGMLPRAITWYPRHWRVKGALTNAQLADARARLAASPAGDLRVLVLHHNIVRGRLSNRWGLTRPQHVLELIAASGADVVCAGHDHEERAELVQRAGGSVVSSTANTLASRARGHRKSALTVLEATDETITLTVWSYDEASARFLAGAVFSVPRMKRAERAE